MDLEFALNGMLAESAKLRSNQGISNPAFMSKTMMTLSSFTAAVEEHLAQYEKDLEIKEAQLAKKYMVDDKMKVTQAERMIDIEIGEEKGQIKYLKRLVSSNWTQVSVIQSRYNHLIKEATTQI